MILTIISYLIPIAALIFVYILLSKSEVRQQKHTEAFRFFILTLIAWLILLFVCDRIDSAKYSIYPLRAALFVGSFAPLFYFIFAQQFVKSLNRKITAVFAGIALSFGLLSLSSLMVGGVKHGTYGVTITNSSILYILQTVYTFIAFAASIILMRYSVNVRNDAGVRGQVRIITAGAILGLLIGLGGGFLTSGGSNLLSPLAVTIFAISTYFAIFRFGLFDIRSFVVRTVGYSFTVVTIALIYIIPISLLSTYVLHVHLNILTGSALVIVTLIAAFLFQPILTNFNRVSNRIFYRDYYEPQDVLDKLSELLVYSVDFERIKNDSIRILSNAIKPTFLRYLVGDEIEKKDKNLFDQLQRYKKDITSINDLSKKKQPELYNILWGSEVAVAVKLRTAKEELGYMIIGHKQSGASYSKADKRLLGVAADEIAISLQNAMRFEQIQQFNLTLQGKVKEATKQLRKTNDKLRALDESKDEFISMASHQLRTPLTSVKGYVSMVLEGDAGKVSGKQKDLLHQAFLSSQRMVDLIADLLNVSRLKTGKFVIESKPTNLATIIETEISQLIETAKSKGVELTYNKPKDFPVLMFDETKIRQVIMNFADNAIHYTPQGGHIQVTLENKPEVIEFTVKDDGIGVPRGEQHHLFTKFYRAGNARKSRPDGTGLGLFMAKKVILAEGGSLIFDSEEGKGSTFGFVFSKAKLAVSK